MEQSDSQHYSHKYTYKGRQLNPQEVIQFTNKIRSLEQACNQTLSIKGIEPLPDVLQNDYIVLQTLLFNLQQLLRRLLNEDNVKKQLSIEISLKNNEIQKVNHQKKEIKDQVQLLGGQVQKLLAERDNLENKIKNLTQKYQQEKFVLKKDLQNNKNQSKNLQRDIKIKNLQIYNLRHPNDKVQKSKKIEQDPKNQPQFELSRLVNGDQIVQNSHKTTRESMNKFQQFNQGKFKVLKEELEGYKDWLEIFLTRINKILVARINTQNELTGQQIEIYKPGQEPKILPSNLSIHQIRSGFPYSELLNEFEHYMIRAQKIVFKDKIEQNKTGNQKYLVQKVLRQYSQIVNKIIEDIRQTRNLTEEAQNYLLKHFPPNPMYSEIIRQYKLKELVEFNTHYLQPLLRQQERRFEEIKAYKQNRALIDKKIQDQQRMVKNFQELKKRLEDFTLEKKRLSFRETQQKQKQESLFQQKMTLDKEGMMLEKEEQLQGGQEEKKKSSDDTKQQVQI